ncbi:MAG: stress response translation initiation inhibitor YciH [Chloroflexota bacterium]
MSKHENRTVWTSEQGDLRSAESRTRKVVSLPPQQQTIYLHRDSKGRGGKTVTLVKKLVLSEDDMKELAKKLKQVCGSGGTIKDDMIEIQGEHREKIAAALIKLGYKVKIAGG